jgi:hypothetical protein
MDSLKQVQSEIYHRVIGQIIRTLFRLAAAYAVFVGIDAETYGEFTAVSVNYIVPVIILAITEVYSILLKRTAAYRARYALAAPPETTMAEVDAMVKAKTPPAVSV